MVCIHSSAHQDLNWIQTLNRSVQVPVNLEKYCDWTEYSTFKSALNGSDVVLCVIYLMKDKLEGEK